jgi:hypothetical protein
MLNTTFLIDSMNELTIDPMLLASRLVVNHLPLSHELNSGLGCPPQSHLHWLILLNGIYDTDVPKGKKTQQPEETKYLFGNKCSYYLDS